MHGRSSLLAALPPAAQCASSFRVTAWHIMLGTTRTRSCSHAMPQEFERSQQRIGYQQMSTSLLPDIASVSPDLPRSIPLVLGAGEFKF